MILRFTYFRLGCKICHTIEWVDYLNLWKLVRQKNKTGSRLSVKVELNIPAQYKLAGDLSLWASEWTCGKFDGSEIQMCFQSNLQHLVQGSSPEYGRRMHGYPEGCEARSYRPVKRSLQYSTNRYSLPQALNWNERHTHQADGQNPLKKLHLQKKCTKLLLKLLNYFTTYFTEGWKDAILFFFRSGGVGVCGGTYSASLPELLLLDPLSQSEGTVERLFRFPLSLVAS